MARCRVRIALAAAWLALAAGAAQGQDGLGTLFHSPEERARLDRLRRGEPVASPQAAQRAREVTGYVKRSDGRGTVWIDGTPVDVSTSKAAPLMQPGAVRAYGDRHDPDLHVQATRPPR